MRKILIIGKRGFLGNSLYKYLKTKFKCKLINFKDFSKIKNKINEYNYIINCSINRRYINRKYNQKYDNDLKISKIIKGKKIKLMFLSSRKVYKSKPNIKENDRVLPKSNYSKNKLISEKKLTNLLGKNLIILRISNIIGDRSKRKKLHYTFVDSFFDNANKGLIYNNRNQFKDFISLDKFCIIVAQIIKKEISGIYNVSIGRKIKTNSIVNWLNFYNPRKCITLNVKNNQHSFYLNNSKLMKKIFIKNSITDLKKYCLKLSKKNFINLIKN